MFTKVIKISDPASGKYIGIAKKDDHMLISDVSSCLAILFQLDNGATVAGHVPMIWKGKESFELLTNAKMVIDEMLRLKKKAINKIIFIGDESNWNDLDSIFGRKIVDALLQHKELSTINSYFFDKERIPNANIYVTRSSIKIVNTTSMKVYDLCLDNHKNIQSSIRT